MLKQKIWRNKSYGKWIHENLTCCVTGEPNPDPHHIKGEGYGTVKAPDFMQIALSHRLHQELHSIGWKAFEEKYEVTQRVMVGVTLHAAISAGGIKFDDIKDHIPDWLIYQLEANNDF